MKVKILQEDIIDGLHKSANIIPTKTGAAFLRSIWLKADNEGLKVMATDSNLEFCGNYQAEVMSEGIVGVQGRSLYELIKKLPKGMISLELINESLKIKQGSREYILPSNDITWFQNFSSFPESETVFWSGDFLENIIDKISFCISDEDTMEAIACMCISPNEKNNTIETCGLNGHQFSMLSFINDDILNLLDKNQMLIQKKYINELKKWLSVDEIELNVSDKRLFLRTSDKKEIFSLPLSYYQYPDYNNFINKLDLDTNSIMTINRKELLEALDRLLIFNTDNNRCTYFEFTESNLVLNSQGQEIGSATESISIQYNGDLSKIAFPTRNLIEILSHFESETLKFILTGQEGPCGISGENDKDYIVIIMPMKIVEETYYSEEDV